MEKFEIKTNLRSQMEKKKKVLLAITLDTKPEETL